MKKYLIETDNLTKKFDGFAAVNSINLKIPQGGIYGFLGPNGAGKSTTIRMLLGLISPTEGKAKLFDKSIDKDRLDILKKVGSMVENPSYYAHLTAYENLNIIREILNVEKSEIERVLNIVGLLEVKDKKVKKFSMGMKQRLGIAQALIGNPELLILDEPTNGLDPAGIREIRALIKGLPEKLGITVVVSSHILSEIELMATDVGIINKGNLIFQGSLEELQKRSLAQIKIGAEPKKEAIDHLLKRGYQVEERDKYIYIKEFSSPSILTKELVINNFEVYHISEDKSNLEDIFLDITRKENQDEITNIN
ncbi:ABC transporter ATP-binding protein [Clostridium sp. D2Q-11]|uniref:ABC transporter ATP-binding protein n=1 Tax=Anaeromonas frigoriresistens TaxID=2683708 RepID=A0A942Z940_9FIRM|nr:ABC transporter ATP-binding protein [Anaeromonas frigoriresistens]MBS4538928.1 ABC transporter ATP-binding protein [Anaeromonas frigoriresistens]